MEIQFQSFMPIINAVASQRRLRGVLTLEVADKQHGWVFSYEESKKYFDEWSQEIQNATEGKSFGNVRLMHQLQTVGKISQPLEFDDANKRIYCTVDITDEKVWEDICNGVYCGFSFSGHKVPPSTDILEKWSKIPGGNLRYVGKPWEVSIVDNPNQPGAYFTVANAAGNPCFNYINENGEIEQREFKITKQENKKMELTLEEVRNTVQTEAATLVQNAMSTQLPTAIQNAITAALTPEFITNAVQSVVATAVKEAVSNAVKELGIESIKGDVKKLQDITPIDETKVVTKIMDTLTYGQGNGDNFDAKKVANAAGYSSEADIAALQQIHAINNGQKK